MGSLADQWDSTPAPTAPAPIGSLSQQWDAVSTETPKTVKTPSQPLTPTEKYAIGLAETPIGVYETAKSGLTGLAGMTWGGLKGAGTLMSALAKGSSLDDAVNAAANTVKQTEQDMTYQPQTMEGKQISQVANLPGQAIQYIGQGAGTLTQKGFETESKIPGLSWVKALQPAASTIAETAVQGAPYVAGLLKATPASITEDSSAADIAKNAAINAAKAKWEGVPRETSVSDTGIPRQSIGAAAAEPIAIASFDNSDLPKTTGFQPNEIADRQGVLSRLGFNQVHKSFVEGDPLMSGALGQASRINAPVGQQIKGMLEDNRATLTNATKNLVENTGGSIGSDEDTLVNRGQIIAAPFDGFRQYFDNAISNLYKQADERSAGAPSVNTQPVSDLLKNPDFTETLLAKDQGSLLNSVQRQFDRFKALSPEGMTVSSAENFRKWLNTVWTPDNSGTLGQIKRAVDDSVLSSAGEDIYAPARALFATKKATLDNPAGVSKIMDFDPQTPINRKVPFEKIPDSITRLPSAQFDNLVDTLGTIRETVPDLKPQADAALAEIKSHMANKLLDIGSKTQEQWDNYGVTKYLNSNISKLNKIFSPEEMQQIQDIQRGGNILRYDSRYPGAAVQTENLLKEGILPHMVNLVGGPLGSAVGGIFGAPGLGAAAGAAGAGKVAGKMTGKAAIQRLKSGMVNLNKLNQ